MGGQPNGRKAHCIASLTGGAANAKKQQAAKVRNWKMQPHNAASELFSKSSGTDRESWKATTTLWALKNNAEHSNTFDNYTENKIKNILKYISRLEYVCAANKMSSSINHLIHLMIELKLSLELSEYLSSDDHSQVDQVDSERNCFQSRD